MKKRGRHALWGFVEEETRQIRFFADFMGKEPAEFFRGLCENSRVDMFSGYFMDEELGDDFRSLHRQGCGTHLLRSLRR